ncbi:GNAT family N-acetyltransferase [Falsirhodobacter algicola]|uniref:GNAT family N-acetyltransferase n=1 Tax=Falsirhodobacter algicola TaxID=2692330 RepID=A0A8J8SLP7_9RHOB|nr:GNAT family N-acetyltransferase [Falsirhodobacter algicola]QUS36702.1 GNAT family N-acetyltransferase [Falsirhodobacter algicola]
MIRPATLADAPRIRTIWNVMITDTLANFSEVEKTPAEVEAAIRERHGQGFAFFVAEDAEDIMGFATYAQFRGGPGYRFTMENTVSLVPRAKGRGLGRALMGAVEDHAKARGVNSMIAGVSSANTEGIGFHAALGYEMAATIPRCGFKWGQWLDLLLMQKFL